jgi:hypothetical protein
MNVLRLGDQALLARGDVDHEELAGPRAELVGRREPDRGAGDFLAVRRPGRVLAEIREAPDTFPGRAHNEDPAAETLGSKSDPLSVRRIGGLDIVDRIILGQVEGGFPAHPLEIDVPVARRPALIDE